MNDLRLMNPDEARLFASWEKAERPYPWTENHFLETATSGRECALVYEVNQERLGFAVVQVTQGEGYLLNIMVDPLRRRQSHGEKLLQKVMIWLKSKEVPHLFLDVDPSNTPAVRLYEKVGFEAVGRRPHAYPRGEEAMLMRKKL